VVAPIFSPAGGSFAGAQAVTITSATSGASIAYTIDGSTPSESGGMVTNGTLYSGTIPIGATTTLKAIAFKSGMADSTVTTDVYAISIAGVVCAPTFSPAAGTFVGAQSVTITSATSGASIAYTTDGSTPSESGGMVTNGTLYSGAASIGASTTLKAIGFKSSLIDSAVTTGVFTMQVAMPTFTPVAYSYTSAQTVTITSATSGASIAYTTDGSTPTESGGLVTHGTLYSGAVLVSTASTTLSAIAFKSGLADSAVATGAYTLQLATPIFSPSGIHSNSPGTWPVTITSAPIGASIAYTLDGSTPMVSGGTVTHGTLYSGAITVSANAIINAIAFQGDLVSAVATAAFQIPPVAPKFSPVAGTYTGTRTVEIYTTTSGASVAFTTDGTTPTQSGDVVTNGTLYSTPLVISATTTLNAIAFEAGGTSSPVSSATYTIGSPPLQVAAPTFGPPAGTYPGAQTVAITTATGGAFLRYTTDGSTPNETAGTLYSGPVPISTTTTLRAIAYQTGFTDSSVTSGLYTIGTPQTAAPVFSSAGSTGHAVMITSATSGASIRYTTNGTTPTEANGTLYSGPVNITAATTLKAVAYESGFTDSPVTSANIGIPTVSVTTPANGSTVP
jgi:hypothetical protein